MAPFRNRRTSALLFHELGPLYSLVVKHHFFANSFFSELLWLKSWFSKAWTSNHKQMQLAAGSQAGPGRENNHPQSLWSRRTRTCKGQASLCILHSGVRGLCQAPFCRINISASVRKDKEKPWHKRNSMSWHFWPKPSSAFCNYMCSAECGVNDQGRGQLDVNQQADCDSVDRHLWCQSRGEREWSCAVLDVAQLLLAEITLRSLGLCCELTYRLEVLKGGLL